MKLFIETIVLDGFPYLPLIYAELRKLSGIDWVWNCIEGVSAPNADTKWVAQMPPRLSEDGTTQWLDSVAAFDKRVVIYRKEMWHSKTAQMNEPLKTLYEPAVLMQMDADEIFTTEQIKAIYEELSFRSSPLNTAQFACAYHVGPNIVITSQKTFGDFDYEWFRAWRVQPGVRFKSHEPPKLENFKEVIWTKEKTRERGLVFDHFAYATEAQVAFKQRYYGSSNNKENGHKYANAVEGWKRLQEAKFPISDLSLYLPFVGPNVTADRIKP